MKAQKIVFLLAVICALTLSSSLISPSAIAKVTGICSNCHTMHNSQGGSDMATFGAASKPWKTDTAQPALLRGTCLGCHGMGEASKIKTIGNSQIPQVYHTDGADLASGNFRYIETGGDDRGHNVIELNNVDGVLDNPPGAVHINQVSNTELTCAGNNGCHGWRAFSDSGSGLGSLKGAHHQNVDGKCDSATEVYNSYRFLRGVKGLENTIDKWQNKSASNHNEYFGASTPLDIDGCDSTECHFTATDIRPANNTISGFCATCHGNFHSVQGIGGTTSPFIRHPTDIVLPSDGEYASYETYSVEAPVGRTTVPGSMSSAVVPGTDVVTCLSCHAAHASNYPDLLRWDYNAVIAGAGSNGTGCFVCHTSKDGVAGNP